MTDIQGSLKQSAKQNEQLGYLQFYLHLLDYIGDPVDNMIHAHDLLYVMSKYGEDNYPKGDGQ